ncbi:hypothetical protein HDU96_001216 [Phlyctochytrium bullatum]|nr:hypothetical protein HDU96_001216 [Phlyctochytrium bullatum]
MLASEMVLLRWVDVHTIPAYVVAWVARCAPKLLSYEFVTMAATAGRLDLIRLLHAFDVRKFCTGTMNVAAGAGQLAVVRFLHFERKECCTADAMGNAVIDGHFDVAQFLAEHRTEFFSDYLLHKLIFQSIKCDSYKQRPNVNPTHNS